MHVFLRRSKCADLIIYQSYSLECSMTLCKDASIENTCRAEKNVRSSSLGKLTLDEESAALFGSCVESTEGIDGGLPIDAGVSDRDTVLKAGRAFGRNVLAASVDIGFDHDTGNRHVTSNELRANVGADLGLIVVVLARVSMGAVNHN